MTSTNGTTALGGASPTNDAEHDLLSEAPFVATATITGDCPILFHRWSNEAVAEKAAAKKAGEVIEVADSHRYRACGNGVVAPVAEWIGRRQAVAS